LQKIAVASSLGLNRGQRSPSGSERDRAIAYELGVAIDRVNGDQGDEDDGSSGALAPV
jgi:hypothetical protein